MASAAAVAARVAIILVVMVVVVVIVVVVEVVVVGVVVAVLESPAEPRSAKKAQELKTHATCTMYTTYITPPLPVTGNTLCAAKHLSARAGQVVLSKSNHATRSRWTEQPVLGAHSALCSQWVQGHLGIQCLDNGE
jgi:Na+/proline symporter